MAKVLFHTCKAMEGMTQDEYLQVKKLLITPSWKYCHESPHDVHAPDPVAVDREQFHISG